MRGQTYEDLRRTLIQLLPPALPILPQEENKINSLYNNLKQLPEFRHKDDEEYQLHTNQGESSSIQFRNTYPVYYRKTLEKYNFSTKQKQYSQNVQIEDFNEHTLKFQSNFQSGNLQKAEKVLKKQTYNLSLQNDINTSGYTQWFFFSVQNGKKDTNYKFNLINCYRDASLFQQGMKILIYTSKEEELNKKGWYRGGQQIKYYNQGRKIMDKYGVPRTLYTLSFNYTFEFDEDKAYFAYNYPYTVTDLHNDLNQLDQRYVKRTILCKTLAQNRVEMITITNNHNSKHKLGIIMTARVHPSQTVSSYAIKGVLEFLTSDDEVAQKLRDNFIFKIIPMLNPDGVIHGHSRTNLSGRDLNRVWINPDPKYHSQIYYLKKAIIQFSRKCPISLFCDFHGHSKKKNAFLFGCSDSQIPYKSRQFPYLYSKTLKTISYQNCTFGLKKDKMGTARGVLWKQLKTYNIFTLQISSCGPSQRNIHFSYKHFEEIGRKFCMTLLLHQCDNDMNKTLLNQAHGISFNKRRAIKELYTKKSLLKFNNSESESDNSQQDCYDPTISRDRAFDTKIIFRTQVKPKTQSTIRMKEKKSSNLNKLKSKLTISFEKKSTQKIVPKLMSQNSIIKPKLFSMSEDPSQLSSPQKQKQKQKQKPSTNIFKPRHISNSSFFNKPLRTKTIQPTLDYYHYPSHRKNMSSMDWTIGNTSNVDLTEKQLLIKTRKSFFGKSDFKNQWKQSAISTWKE